MAVEAAAPVQVAGAQEDPAAQDIRLYVTQEMKAYADNVSRFASRDRFAAYNGTAPIEVSSGNRIIYRLSLRGNRRLNHAIHMAAITQIRYKHSDGRAYYDKKIDEGKTLVQRQHRRTSETHRQGGRPPVTTARRWVNQADGD
jgi:hypothetical protein